MSAEAAKILELLNQKSADKENNLLLGNLTSISPLGLKLDEIGYSVTSGLLINAELKDYEKEFEMNEKEIKIENATIKVKSNLKQGDRVLVAKINHSCYIILAKVV